VDSTLRISLNSTLLSDSVVNKTIVATTARASKDRINQVVAKGAAVWIVDADAEGHVDLRLLLKRMGREGIASVLVEGGSQINSALIKQKLVDKVAVFVAPKILGSGLSALQNLGIDSLEQSIRLHDLRKRQVGEDILLLGRISLN
nr:bifunctional diaminohydroxyphosphoribosylaminopyrimidine deaminase/5-amino-6-(5-phosphoribosylamino)uracil reductase [candidate division KSB1 bacterium]NIR73347.1 bifunctional diaminohydroxyphosphoribosylaminopyrimidine deaminase/5-amino-6-(5-phosphoribosylamino)uracil reductase [candidate division KSB1 bacterium]NIS25227.1 bifunctional diaminohydroxyphosphoribosylaminopyrimidine deaminase/5-amino-6-(5-phosphoribosylamino)uracil reductase [candidate division KSB1 bacterium]NIT72130.1 bifuncti